jgi:hypothetical protein
MLQNRFIAGPPLFCEIGSLVETNLSHNAERANFLET